MKNVARCAVSLIALATSACAAVVKGSDHLEGSTIPPASVVFTGSAQSPISSGVAVPANRAYYWTSGTVPPVLNASADTISELQAGFIGRWGEWYYTANFGDQGVISAPRTATSNKSHLRTTHTARSAVDFFE